MLMWGVDIHPSAPLSDSLNCRDVVHMSQTSAPIELVYYMNSS
jgi:hypothetical protein